MSFISPTKIARPLFNTIARSETVKAVGKSCVTTSEAIPSWCCSVTIRSAMELAVTGSATVTVPAGQFETWEAELRGGQAPVHFFVTKSMPHRVVREELVGTPVEFVLVK